MAVRRRIEETNRVIAPGQSYGGVDDNVSQPILRGVGRTPLWWFLGFAVGFVLLMLYLYTVVTLIIRGVGIFGNNIPVAWALPIINFVWWIGIGHAGTLISAILLLFRQDWRTSINRFAEAMTLFAVVCAGLYPILHLGRPWLFYWLVPYPNTYGLWPQFRSPLDWDFFAISTYASVSALFWFIGLVPDLATLRDKATRPFPRLFYGTLALGWRGSAKHWQRYQRAYLLLAALSTPVRSLDHRPGLRLLASSRLEQHHLAALLRRRRRFRRVCNGADFGNSPPVRLRPSGPDHQKTPRQLCQGDARDRVDRGVRLRDRALYRLVLGDRIRTLHGL
jgi:hypothetical protein